MDISDLCENIEDDYYLSSFFPAKVKTHLQPLIEQRVKLLLKHRISLTKPNCQISARFG